MAVKYAHRIHRHRKDVAVLWFFGNTAADFEKSYLSPIESRLLLEENVDGLDWITRANGWLQDEKNGAWLAVIDNDCLDINPSSDEEESFWQLVGKAIPTCSHGTLLVTSRKRPREGFRDYCTLDVGEMTTEESDTLLRAILPEDTEEEEVAALANREERTPLALIEAVDKSYPGLSNTRIMLSSLWSGMTSRGEKTSDLGERFMDRDHQSGNVEQGSQESSNTAMLSKTALRQEHPSTLTSMNSLPQVVNTQGKDEEAERMYRQTLQSYETILGKQHPSTLTSMNNMAFVLSMQGKHEEAEEMHRQVRALRERVLAEDHPDRLASQYALVDTYQANEQVEVLEHIVKIQEKLAEDHPNRLASQHTLAGAYRANEQIDDAAELLEHVIKVQEKLAEDHPSGIGEASLVLGLISSTIAMFEAALEIYEAASDTGGLPKKLRIAAEQIPLVYHVLILAKQNINAKNVTEEALQKAKPVLERCEKSTASVKDIFDKTIPTKDASRVERLRKALGVKMKSNKVKEHMEEIFKSMELLAQNQVFLDAEALKDIKEAIEQLSNLPDEEEQPQFVHSGADAINANTGAGTQKNYNNAGPGKQYNAEKQVFGGDQGTDSS